MAGRYQEAFGNNSERSMGGNPGSLKSKLLTLEEMIKGQNDEMNFHKKEVQLQKSEKETLQAVLTMKTADVKDSLTAELKKIYEAMCDHFKIQKGENSRLQQQITSLKGEKTALQQQMIGLQRRTSEVEMQVGNDENMFG